MFLDIIPVMSQTHSQRGRSSHQTANDTSLVVKAYIDSLHTLRTRMDSIYSVNDSLRDQLDISSRYYKLFVPMTFYHDVIEDTLSYHPDKYKYLDNEEINNALLNIYLKRPDLVGCLPLKYNQSIAYSHSRKKLFQR